MTALIPSIAGAVSSTFNKSFGSYITSGTLTKPLTGSFGISFAVNEDLSLLFTRFNGNEDEVLNYLVATYTAIPPAPGFKTGVKPLTKRQAQQIISYYLWATSDQDEFFLRKGCKTLGRYRRKGSYTFNANEGYYHRINYEWIADATEQEKAAIWQHVPDTVLWV